MKTSEMVMRRCRSVVLIACTMALAQSGRAVDTRVGSNESPDTNTLGSRSSFVIGISPFLQKSVKDDVYRGIVRLLVEDLPLNSTLAVYDAFDLKTVTKVELPAARAFNSPKTRANQFASAVRDIREFLAKPPAAPKHASFNFEGAIRLPQFYEFFAEASAPTNSPVALLLIGSPLYLDTKEPAFSMVDGYFPSDGHLQAAREQSIFGFSEEASAMPRLAVHWVYFGDPWINDLHREKVTRFWSLYWRQRAGELTSFSGDLPTALRGFRQGDSVAGTAVKRWAVDPNQKKIEMLRITRNVDVADWLTRDGLAEPSPPPPDVLVGKMKIGIRWRQNIDLDLYAAPRHGGETLFFQHPRSPDGFYYKDHRSSPGREFEFVEFETPVDVREVEAFVNFYRGSLRERPRGEVRIEFAGRIYGAAFVIQATEGNQGRAGRDQREYWTRIPVQEILKVVPAVSPAGEG